MCLRLRQYLHHSAPSGLTVSVSMMLLMRSAAQGKVRCSRMQPLRMDCCHRAALHTARTFVLLVVVSLGNVVKACKPSRIAMLHFTWLLPGRHSTELASAQAKASEASPSPKGEEDKMKKKKKEKKIAAKWPGPAQKTPECAPWPPWPPDSYTWCT